MSIMENLTSSESLKVLTKSPIGALIFFILIIAILFTYLTLELQGFNQKISLLYLILLPSVVIIWFLFLVTKKPHHLYPANMFSNQELWLNHISSQPIAREIYTGYRIKKNLVQNKIKKLENTNNKSIKDTYELANIYRLQKNYSKAIELYEMILTLNLTDDKFLINNLALCKKRNGEIDEAIILYKKAISLDPTFAKPKNNLAYLLGEEKKDLQLALVLINEAINEIKHNPFYIATKGFVLMQMSNIIEAKEYFIKAKKIRELSKMKESESITEYLKKIELMKEEEEEEEEE